MSQYNVEHGEHWIAFGWDNPLRTFFAQVEDNNATDPDKLLLDIGSPFDSFYTDVEHFANVLSQKLCELGISDFSLNVDQKVKLLSDQDGIGG